MTKTHKEKSQEYFDKRKHTTDIEIQLGECALEKRPKRNKLSPSFNPSPFHVTNINIL